MNIQYQFLFYSILQNLSFIMFNNFISILYFLLYKRFAIQA